MRYTTAQYAEALANAVEGASRNNIKTIARAMVRLLRQKKHSAKLPAILREAKRRYVHKKGIITADIISAAPLSPAIRKEIRRIAGVNALVNEVTRPEVLAGISIVLNGAYRIDASAAGIIQKLFADHERSS